MNELARKTTDGFDRRAFLRMAAATMTTIRAGEAAAAGAPGRSREWTAIERGARWFHTQPLTFAGLAGKVAAVQFGTFTCINWLRTLPYIRAWATTYKDGLVMLGVNTPEFAFEHDPDEVGRALKRLRVEHPVVIDNDFGIWRAFDNQYWPALYILDGRGRVQYRHFGEGEYEATDRALQRLLTADGRVARHEPVAVEAGGVERPADWNSLRSPETYVGYERTERFASGRIAAGRRRNYVVPTRLSLNEWAVGGEWTFDKQHAGLHEPSGRLAYRFHARDLHLVLGPPSSGGAVRFRVTLDGRPPGTACGLDVDEDGRGAVVEARLYQLIRQSAPVRECLFEIEFLDPGVNAYAFTFG